MIRNLLSNTLPFAKISHKTIRELVLRFKREKVAEDKIILRFGEFN